jgi:hypothetical protein
VIINSLENKSKKTTTTDSSAHVTYKKYTATLNICLSTSHIYLSAE